MTRYRYITTKLLLLLLLLTTGAGEVWGVTEMKYSRSGVGSGSTQWKESDITDWTANTAGNTPTITGGLYLSGGNVGYEYQKELTIHPAATLTITGTWNTGSSLGRATAYNYLQFGMVELRAYGQAQRGTIVINGEETELTTSGSDVRDNKDWTFNITINQATGAVSYTITPPSGAKSGTGNAGVLDFSAIKMGYKKTGSNYDTHQTLKWISISQETYAYTVNATGSLDQEIASGSDGPGASLTIPYHRYILSGSTLHKAERQGSDPHYGVKFTLDVDNKSVNIAYTNYATNVAVFREAEDFMTEANNSYVNIRCSNQLGGYSSTAKTVASLPKGAYTITAASYGRPTNFVFSSGGADKWTHSASAWDENTSGTVQLAEGDLQVSGGSSSYPLDYVYVTRVFAYEEASSDRTKGNTEKPTLVNARSATVSYKSSNEFVATVNASGDVSFHHNGTAIITATATIDAVEYTTTHTVTVTGETEVLISPSYDSGTKTETYTLSGTGYVGQTVNGTLVTMSYGSATETQTVDNGHASCIDANGFTHVFLNANENATGIPTMGTYYTFVPKQNGTLTLNAMVSADSGKRNGLRLVDGDGNILESITSIGTSYQDYAFNTLLIKDKIYYVFAETGAMKSDERRNEAFSTLYLSSFTFKRMEGTTISLIDQSLLFTTETNSNRKQLDRTIPGFNLEFDGGDGAKYTGGGIFVLRNASAENNNESQNGKITITPRFASGSTFAITGVTLNIGSKAENKETDPTSNPTISVNGVEKSVSANSNISWSSSDLSSADNSKLVILLKGSTASSTKNKIQVYLNSITFNYSTTSTTLDDSKGTIDLRSAASSTYIYGYEGDDVENDTYFFLPHAFSGDVTFEYEGDGFAEATTTVKKLLDTNNVSGLSGSSDNVQGLIHFGENDTYESSKLNAYDKYKVHIGSGVGKLTASFAATDYFAASSATTRLYSRDYKESPAKVLASGDSYTWPAGNGMTFEITTEAAGTITLNGGENITMTAGEAHTYTVVSAENKVVVKNTGDSNITITKVKVYRKSATLNFSYVGAVGAGSDVLFASWNYTPNTFTISSDTETGIASLYEPAGMYAITQPVNGVSIDPETGALTVGAEADNGLLQVTLTVNPKKENKELYAPLTKTITLKVVDGMWDFRNYSQSEHWTLYNSSGWYGQNTGWYASRDNASFAEILRKDGTPLPRALALETMGKHRLLHSNHGFLHLQGRGNGASESPNGGGQLRIPAKAGMLVELNCYAEDDVSEMAIDGVTDLEGNDVTELLVSVGDTKSQYFLAKSDGYIVVRNPSNSLDLHIRYINVSADMAFKYGNETYIDASVGTWSNPVMNQGTTTITYERTDGTGTYTVDSGTGVVTIGSGQYGTFTIKATGSGTGVLAGKSNSYMVNVIGLGVTNGTHTISVGGTFNLKDNITTSINTSGANDETLKEKVTFSLVEESPTVSLSGSTLTIEGVQRVALKATLGAIELPFYCEVTGGTLTGGLNPVIANDATSYTITLSGSDIGLATGKATYFDVDKMKTGALGEVKSIVDNSTVTFTEDTGAKTLTISGLGGYGGVIPIYVNYKYNSTDYPIEGTLTIAYTSNEWTFTNNMIPTLGGWYVSPSVKVGEWVSGATFDKPTDTPATGEALTTNNWKFTRKIGNKTNTSIIYYYNHSVEGQNALVIPETEGLHLFASPSNKQMGVEMTKSEAPYECRDLMLLRGSKLTIPKLKKGQWVEMRWNRHAPDMGERILMTNLSDAAGTPITSTYKIGNTFYNLPWSTSTYMFQATNDGDVTFEIADNIYVDIQKIILHEPGWTFQSSLKVKLKGYDNLHTPTDEAKASWTGETAPDIDWQYIWDDQGSHTITFLSKEYQNAPNAPQTWKFEMDEMLTRSGAVMETNSTDGGEATLTYNGGWGKVKVTMTSYSQNMKYVANQKSWTITFGQAPKQTYPYTWDFTKFFSNTLGSTNNENTWAAVSYDAGTAKPLRVAIYNNHSSSNYGSDGWPNSYNKADYDSYYVEGAQLVSYGLRDTNNGVIRETEGLGFILDADNDLNHQPDQNMLILNMTNTVNTARQTVNGQTWITDTGEDAAKKHTNNSHLTIGSGGKIIVPKPNDADNFANYYIYIMSSHKPTAATSVTDRSTDSEVPTGVYKYKFSANDNAVFTFESTDDVTDSQLSVYGDGKDPTSHRQYTDIYAIAVTKDYKSVKRLNEVGWATESRDYAVDYSLDSLLTNLPIRAYSVIARSSNPIYSTDKTKTTVRLQDRSYVVPARQGLVLKQVTNSPGADGSTYTVPLFVPAVTTAIEPDYTYANNLMRPNLTEREFDSETEEIDKTTYTRFILSEKYMTWRKEDATVSYDEHFTSALVPGFYRMHIYGNSSYDVDDPGTNRNTLGANKAYLVLPSDKINDPIWEANTPVRRFEFIGIEGVSDMEEIIDTPNPSDTTNKNAIYSLSGLLMGEDESVLAPGIYIRNGKKFMVK